MSLKKNKFSTLLVRLQGLCAWPVILLVILVQTAFPLLGDSQRPPNTDEPWREVRVGLYENKPKIFTNGSGEADGIFPTILEEIARQEKWHITYVPCEWDECLEALEMGEIDLMPDVAFSIERQKRFDFNAVGVLLSWSSAYARKGKAVDNLTDLEGLRIAVMRGSIQQQVLGQMVAGFNMKVYFVEVPTFDDAFDKTALGEADVAVTNYLYGDLVYRQHDLKKTSIVLNPVTLHFAAVTGKNGDLLKAIDNAIIQMKDQPGSVYYKALERWIEQPVKKAVPRYFKYILYIMCVIIILATLFIWLLQRQVDRATASLSRANEMLQVSEKKFRDIFEKHTAVKLIVNPDNGGIVEANKSAEKFYGWSRAEMLLKKIQELYPLLPEQVESALARARQKKQYIFESQQKLADGSIRDVEVFSSAVEINGQHFLHLIIHDITDKRGMEERYRQSQKMEAVGTLAGGIAHDYNNMLNVILGYTELALDKIDPSDPLYDDLSEVQNAAERSADITHQLLAFARKQTVEPMVLNLNDSIRAMLRMLERLIDEDIELLWRPAKGLWPVYIDPSQLDQILVNLCTNARDAIGGRGGRIVIETDNVSFDEAYCEDRHDFTPGDYCVLAVSDNGCGMDHETVENIFEPFFTTKSSGKGTGLGLSTVYGIVKQNNGVINIYSEPGQGSVFRIYLHRFLDRTVRQESTREEELPLGSGEVVLLVEDEKAILKLGSKFLEQLGYQVLTAETPAEAMRIVDENSIDLLITDVILPEMNGGELATRLRSQHPEIRTLFMSGYSNIIINHQGFLEEDTVFLQKPFSLKNLALKVRKGLGR